MAVGNTFGATALTSYGGFWISFAITLTPGGFGIIEAYGGESPMFLDAFGFYLTVPPPRASCLPNCHHRTLCTKINMPFANVQLAALHFHILPPSSTEQH